MRLVTLCLLAPALAAAESRFARLAEVEGNASVQLRALDAWRPASRNLVLLEGSRLRTLESARAGIESDDGAEIRLGENSQLALTDYLLLSTGQRISRIAVDQGTAYVTGEPADRDAMEIVAPGLLLRISRGVRLRLRAMRQETEVRVIEGAVRYVSPRAEIGISEGQTLHVPPADPERFTLDRERIDLPLDAWSEERDRRSASPASAQYLRWARAGLAELDAGGTWMETSQYGVAWRPRAAQGWAPFSKGRWVWYAGLGYTWIDAEPWGWLPGHYGRWTTAENLGWIWIPPQTPRFHPGDVYWMRGGKAAGWGPLAAGEAWDGASVPRLYLNAYTTFGRWDPEALDLEPSAAARPKDPLSAMTFLRLLSVPAMDGILAAAPALRTRGAIQLSEPPAPAQAARQPEPRFERPAEPVASVAGQAQQPEAVAQPVVIVQPAPATRVVESIYAVPVYTGVVVVNPSERPHHPRPAQPATPAQPAVPATPAVPAAPATPAQPAAPAQPGLGIPRIRGGDGGRPPEANVPKAGSEEREIRVPRPVRDEPARKQQQQ